MARVMMMAAGTGGHVFPGLAVARELMARGHSLCWLGTPAGMEQRLVPAAAIDMEVIDVKGLRGNGLLRWLFAPIVLLRAVWQALVILRRRKPNLVVGMGGFVTGPGGLGARLLGIPLVIHEQNAVPGLANRLLSHLAVRVLEAFPGSFAGAVGAMAVGNPVRPEIAAIPAPEGRWQQTSAELPRLVIIGGSLGAQALNELVPAAVAVAGLELEIRHQAGKGKTVLAVESYQQAGVKVEVTEFIEDMAAAYQWADLIICRAGALTVSELAAAGLPAILVPYPYAVDDHQSRNAAYLADQGAAVVMQQGDMTSDSLGQRLQLLLTDRAGLKAMAIRAKTLAMPNADKAVADICEEVMEK